VRRREFIIRVAVVAAALTAPNLARSQTSIARIGVLAPGPSAAATDFIDELKAGLREAGLVDGENLHLDAVFGQTHEGLDAAAAQLIGLNVTLIVAWSTPAVAAAKRATSTKPIVMVGIADPIGAKLVDSLARPGGNVTGTTNLSRDLGGKVLDFLLQIVPQVRRLGVLLNPSNEAAALQLRDTEVAAQMLGLELYIARATKVDDLEPAIKQLTVQRVSALVVLADPLFTAARSHIAEIALAHRLPSAFSRRENAEAGALLSYGPSLRSQFRRAAAYAAKILRGAAPSELPVEQPTHLELVLNLRTAKALDLTIPHSLLIRADEVIE
jgi:putative tryptophan/tyrosine transport system substrate-binding protein